MPNWRQLAREYDRTMWQDNKKHKAAWQAIVNETRAFVQQNMAEYNLSYYDALMHWFYVPPGVRTFKGWPTNGESPYFELFGTQLSFDGVVMVLLAESGDQRAINFLLPKLTKPLEGRDAAEAFAYMPEAIQKKALPELVKKWHYHRGWGEYNAAGDALVAIGNVAIEVIMGLYKSGSKRDAIYLLGKIGTQRALLSILSLIDDQSPEAQVAAIAETDRYLEKHPEFAPYLREYDVRSKLEKIAHRQISGKTDSADCKRSSKVWAERILARL